jgi:hypothetical protein
MVLARKAAVALHQLTRRGVNAINILVIQVVMEIVMTAIQI